MRALAPSSVVTASETQYVGTKWATVRTSSLMRESGTQAPPRKVSTMPPMLPAALRPCSRRPRRESMNASESGVSEMASWATSSRARLAAGTLESSSAKTARPRTLVQAQAPRASTRQPPRSDASRRAGETGAQPWRRLTSLSEKTESTRPTVTTTLLMMG